MPISVITTTYNCGEYISDAIRSILNQTYRDFEYLIIDDGSTDNTEEIINSIDDKRIKYYKIEHIGRSRSLNFALQKAGYDLIALMDADDISHPLRLEKQLEVYKGSNQLVFCDTAYFINEKIKYLIISEPQSDYINKLILHGHFNNSSSLFNRLYILNYGGYNEDLLAYEDYDLWLRIMKDSEFIVASGIYHYVRLRNDSMTTTNPGKLKYILYSIQEYYFKNLTDYGIRNPNDKLALKGWREFFYGELELCREYWDELKLSDRSIKIHIAYVMSYLPSIIVKWFKNKRIFLRLKYIFYYLKSFRSTQLEFYRVLNKIASKEPPYC
ncbi:MAG: glycosyltransferase [Melioribacteraceae bacterium]|nr:MAG: glycosyltransferase [Melioribacteraceae bacterium]